MAKRNMQVQQAVVEQAVAVEPSAVMAVEPNAALAVAPTAAAYAAALVGWAKPYAPSPQATWRVVAGPGMAAAKHGACATRHASVVALLGKGPTTVAQLVAAGYTMADVRWGLSPAHRGGAKLVVVP
jgi:hypothetical protein